MAEVIVNKISTDIVENYSKEDLNLIPSFDVISQFNPETDVVEFSIYNEQNLLQYINYNYTNYTVTLDYNTKKNAISSVNVNPEEDLVREGYDQGNYTVIYNFLRNQISSSQSSPYYIKEISSDRTEIRVANNNISNEDLKELINNFKLELTESPYFEDFEINFGNNNIFLANNILIDTTTEQYTVLIKLYESLETSFNVKDTLTVVLQTAEEVSYNVNFPSITIAPPLPLELKGPNFNLSLNDKINNSTTFTSKKDLFDITPENAWTGSLGELQNILKDKGITPNVDYSDFNNFIYFSSAEQRVRNFYYKVGLIQDYSASIADLGDISSGDTSGSIAEYQTLINNVLINLDEYEKYQYYSSGSLDIYPKTNDTPPYNLALTSSVLATDWLTDQAINSGSEYDLENSDSLNNSLPSYTRDDLRNIQFFRFLDMVGQSFDNIWVYTKDLSNRFDADNRLAYGISKDIVADAIRSMGVNLYQNNFDSSNLLSSLTGINPGGGILPPTGSEVIETYISASDDLTIIDDVNKEFYKIIFHNLPLLLKQKGSIAGLRNLINTFGIPDTVLRISEFGGKDKDNSNDWDYFQNEFNYAWDVSGSLDAQADGMGGEFPFSLNSEWESTDDVPESVAFRFKLNPSGGLPSEDTFVALADFNTGGTNGVLALEYTGSGYLSSSYSGSIPSSSNEYATLAYYNGSTKVVSVDAPFYNNDWWTLYINKNSTTYTLKVGNQIYNGGDGFKVGFTASNSATDAGGAWASTTDLEIPGADVTIGSNNYIGFTGSIQEIRYYNCALSDDTFYDFVMNSDSIEGSSPSSSADNLCFRARLKSIEGSATLKSSHPKISGSVSYITQSFSSDSDFRLWNYRPQYWSPHTYFVYQDQPAAGIKNRITEKIRTENLSLPSGDTLSPIRSVQQNYLTKESGSYTKDISLLEIAFSPQNEINDDINSSMGYFNIGEYIGDPRQIYDSVTSYPDLDYLQNTYFQKYYKNYDLNDYIRLIKFFDNSLFKMIKDFTPTKSSLATGVVIKQHILERNKQKPPSTESSQSYYTSSVNSGFIEGGTGGSFIGTNNSTISTGSLDIQINRSTTLDQIGEWVNALNQTPSVNDGELFTFNTSDDSITYTNPDGRPNKILYIVSGSSNIATPSSRDVNLQIFSLDRNISLGQINNINPGGDNVVYSTSFVILPNEEIEIRVQPLSSTTNNAYTHQFISTTEFVANSFVIPTKSGSLNYIRTTQDEFYNGELSGSIILASDGELIPKSLNLTGSFVSNYDSVVKDPQAGAGSDGALYYRSTSTGNGPLVAISRLDFNENDADSNDRRSYFENLNPGDILSLDYINGEGTTFRLNLTISSIIEGLVGDFKVSVVPFKNTDWVNGNISEVNIYYDPNIISNNVIENNVEDSRLSTIYQDIDYSSNMVTPVNLNLLSTNEANRAPIQDSNYGKKAWRNSRYDGTRVSSIDFNIPISK